MTTMLGRDCWTLVAQREAALLQFLKWASAYERHPSLSRRFEQRRDVHRVRAISGLFEEPWWAVVVYSCFDSITGTRAVAPRISKAMSPAEARRIVDEIALPRGSVQFHRQQAGNRGAKTALVSACSYAQDFHGVLFARCSFEERYDALRSLEAEQWGRTTCFDVLARAGMLGIGGQEYRPTIAYLAGSTGPRKGFATVLSRSSSTL